MSICMAAVRQALLVSVPLVLPLSAAAQDARGEVGVTYGVTTDISVRETGMKGFVAAVTGNIGERFGIVGEISGNYWSNDLPGDFDPYLRIHSFLAGLKIRPRAGRIEPYGQVLAGITHIRGRIFREPGSNMLFTIQPGGGVDIILSSRAGIRVQTDSQFQSWGGYPTLRFALGTVVRF